MTHWLTTFDPDDGEPAGFLCECEIAGDHDGAGNLMFPDIGGGEVAVADVLEGVVTYEDMMRAGLRAARVNVRTAAQTRADREEVEAMTADFLRASRVEDGRCPDRGSGIPGGPGCGGEWHGNAQG